MHRQLTTITAPFDFARYPWTREIVDPTWHRGFESAPTVELVQPSGCAKGCIGAPT